MAVQVRRRPTPRAATRVAAVVRTRRPRLNPFRAAVLALFDRYLLPDYRLGALEAQKLTYVLQECGQPLHLTFVKGQFGPYAEDLHPALRPLEGHFIRGYGDRTQKPEIRLVPGVIDEIERFLTQRPDTAERVNRATRVIEGFETPYGLELLATVHWAIRATGAVGISEICDYVRGWTERKGQLFTSDHVRAALERLHEESLTPAGG